RIKQKGDSKCIPWKNLKDLILTHPNTKKKVDVFALSIYDLVVFPKALGQFDEAVTDLFDRLDKSVTPVPSILAETFRSLNAYRRAVDKVSYRVFSENYSSLKEIVAIPRRMISREKNGWQFFRILKKRTSNGELLGCFQMRSYIDVVISAGSLYLGFGELRWLQEEDSRDVQCLEPDSTDEKIGSRNSELGKKIEKMEEEKMNLRLDMDVQNLETKKLRKGKNKAEKDLDSLKTDYKKLRLSMRTVGLGKTSEQWHQEIQEEKIKADR
ncbi:hypothetical protein Golax_003828, partial [Gossypium laxum]|nr:hypothetical protein [Gossypium laxum]